ncbi:AtpZ/AtpI family protein [Winogradskyella rapida]|uniref:AtpZ/AtpI family protein n=1 Tax=Winogradskyella rapida TaxID=549701 RepID=A0ABW3KTJ9_9FLAO
MPKPSKTPSKFLRFAGVGFQMGGVIYLGHYLGTWLDATYGKTYWETSLTLLSVFASIYLVISQVINLTKEDD